MPPIRSNSWFLTEVLEELSCRYYRRIFWVLFSSSNNNWKIFIFLNTRRISEFSILCCYGSINLWGNYFLLLVPTYNRTWHYYLKTAYCFTNLSVLFILKTHRLLFPFYDGLSYFSFSPWFFVTLEYIAPEIIEFSVIVLFYLRVRTKSVISFG